MNQSKLLEWLLENDCPFEWRVDDYFAAKGAVQIVFYQEENNEQK